MIGPDSRILFFLQSLAERLIRIAVAVRANSPVYTEKVETHIRNSYKGHYRRMVPPILDTLAFQSGNRYHQPVIEALDYLKAQKPGQRNIWLADAPIEGIVPKSLRSLLIRENAHSKQYIDRISYEICVLRALRDGLRFREIWAVGVILLHKILQDVLTYSRKQHLTNRPVGIFNSRFRDLEQDGLLTGNYHGYWPPTP